MALLTEEFEAHLRSRTTHVCRAWAITRSDGVQLGFTDHDKSLSFEGCDFKADTGLAAAAVSQATGLAVDNTEAVGVLSDAAITEADIAAGRFDGAEVRAWLVNWREPQQRMLLFRGSIGEVSRTGGAFTAELRGLTEALNVPRGRVFQAPCAAVLGDGACKFDLTQPGFVFEGEVELVEERKRFTFSALNGFDDRWFEAGRCEMVSGAAAGLAAMIKNDRLTADGRIVELWEALRAPIEVGDTVRFVAGCDKRIETCRLKFNNIVNFRGFPHIPGEDWMMSYPSDAVSLDGGSLFQ